MAKTKTKLEEALEHLGRVSGGVTLKYPVPADPLKEGDDVEQTWVAQIGDELIGRGTSAEAAVADLARQVAETSGAAADAGKEQWKRLDGEAKAAAEIADRLGGG